MEENKITFEEFINDETLLKVNYIIFSDKLDIVMDVINAIVDEYGYINSSILRKFAIDIIIDTVTNIDMSLECSNGINGYDYMCYIENGFETILSYIKDQYEQFMTLFSEQADDYNSGRLKKVVTADES